MIGWRAVPVVVAAAIIGAAAPAPAAEILVQAQVVDVVAVDGGTLRPVGDCRRPRPAADAGLVDLLGWDLRVGCPAPPNAYRVYYRWDGRTYSRVTAEPPGDTVPLRVRIR